MAGLGQSENEASPSHSSVTTTAFAASTMAVNGTSLILAESSNATRTNLLANWTLPGGRVECDSLWYYGPNVYFQPPGQCAAVCTTSDTYCFSAATSALHVCTSTWNAWYTRQNSWLATNPATGSTFVSTSTIHTSLFTVYPTTSTSGVVAVTDVYSLSSYSAHPATVRTLVESETVVYLLGEPSTSTSLSTLAWTSTAALSNYLTPIISEITYTNPHTTYIGPPPGANEENIYIPTGFPEPTPDCSIRSVHTVDCGSCTLTGGTVDLLWWPPTTSSALDGAGTGLSVTRTAVVSGRTYTSPTVYISINSVYASDSCSPVGQTYSDVILSLASAEVSTVYGWAADPHAPLLNDPFATSPYGRVNPAGARPLNFSHILSPPLSIYEDQPSCLGFCATVLPDYHPILAIPEGLRDMDPAWASCGIGLQGYYDPPIALQPASVVAGVTTPFAATTTEPPTPGGGTDSSIAPQTTPVGSAEETSPPRPVSVIVGSTSVLEQTISAVPMRTSSSRASVGSPSSTGVASGVSGEHDPPISDSKFNTEPANAGPKPTSTANSRLTTGSGDAHRSVVPTTPPEFSQSNSIASSSTSNDALSTSVSDHSINAADILSEALETYSNYDSITTDRIPSSMAGHHVTDTDKDSAIATDGIDGINAVLTVAGNTLIVQQSTPSGDMVVAAHGTTMTILPSSIVNFSGQTLSLDSTKGLLVDGVAIEVQESNAQATITATLSTRPTTMNIEAVFTLSSATLTAVPLPNGLAVIEENGSTTATLTSGGESAVVSGQTILLISNGVVAGASTATFSKAKPAATNQMTTFTIDGQTHTALQDPYNTAGLVVDETITLSAEGSAQSIGGVAISLQNGTIVVPSSTPGSSTSTGIVTFTVPGQETASPANAEQSTASRSSGPVDVSEGAKEFVPGGNLLRLSFMVCLAFFLESR